jgi:predicted aspartyl protease
MVPTQTVWLRRRTYRLAVSLQGVLLAGIGWCGAALPASAAGLPPELPSPDVAQYSYASPTTLDHIGRVMAPVMVDGEGPFRFVIDTGASRCSVGPALARTLGLKLGKVPSIELEGITGSAAVSAVTVQNLRAGSFNLMGSLMPVLWAPVMAGADGILGVAGLRDQTLFVDFQRNRVVLADDLNPEVRMDYSRVRTQSIDGGLMAVDAYVGRVRVIAVIDTGSERSLGNAALAAALNLRDSPGKLERITAVYGATRQVEAGRMVSAPIIAVGPLRISGVDLIYGDFHIFQLWRLEHRPAMILGMDVLGTVNAIGFDFRHHELFVSGARNSGNPYSHVRTYSSSSAIH